MKKIIAALLFILMVISTFALVSCNNNEPEEKEETLKFGLGVYTNVVKATDATEDVEGQGNVTLTGAVVTVDANGKIVACKLDTADYTVKYTADGKAIANDSFQTKLEQGDAYGMLNPNNPYASKLAEWYNQAAAFEAFAKGKTADELKACLDAETNKGNKAVISAGCTIKINEFVLAIEKAYKNAVASEAVAANTLKLTSYTEQTCKDATDEANGQNKLATTFFAAAVDANGKVVVASNDCIEVDFTFDTTGASAYDATKAVASKKEQGDAYGMKTSPYGSKVGEWYEHSAAFDKACVGKTAAEIKGLMAEDGKGVKSLQDAGCTIYVTGFVKAAAKIG